MSAFRSFFHSAPFHKKAFLCVMGLVAVHSASVEAFRWKTKVEPEFAVGSADEQLTESLSPGDMVLFNRTAYLYHFPTALLILAQKYVYDSEFDHAGVIMMDLGVPYLVERTPFGGVKYRRFEDRIRNSSASHIVVISAEMKKDFDEIQKRNLRRLVVEELSKQNNFQGSEFFQFLMTIDLFGAKEGLLLYCLHSDLINTAWTSLGYKFARCNGDGKITLKTLHDRDVVLKSASTCSENGTNKDDVLLAAHDIIIRSS